MNCSLKSDRHKSSPKSCVHIEVLHLIHRALFFLVAHVHWKVLYGCHMQLRVTKVRLDKGRDETAHNLLIFGVCVVHLCHCLRFLSFLKRRVPSYLLTLQDNSGVPVLLLSRRVSSSLHPELYLFATLGLDCVLLHKGFPVLDKSVRQGALSIPGLFRATANCSQRTVKASFIIVGFDFATILSSPSCSCILFANVLVQLVKLKF